VHAGGVLKDASIANQTPGGVREVVAPKMGAMTHLQALSWAWPTAATAVFSSTASLLGPPGQANYAAANAALNAWSNSQQASGKPQPLTLTASITLICTSLVQLL
jgi:NAD(P)-dependent dehydrogenase (short-subunit alcohol dehydrogenase family)